MAASSTFFSRLFADVRAALAALAESTRRAVGGFAVMLPMVLIFGAVLQLIMRQTGLAALPHANPADQQSIMLWTELSKQAVQIVFGVVTFPLLDAASIYIYRRGVAATRGGWLLAGAFCGWALWQMTFFPFVFGKLAGSALPGAGLAQSILADTSGITGVAICAALGAAAAILVDRVTEALRPAAAPVQDPGAVTITGALNWSLARYGRMFGPHAAAYLSITLGLIVIVPGILFGLMYAFTDAIAATDPKAKKPLARSQRFTRGRRRRITLTWLPYALFWYLPGGLWLIYEAEGAGLLATIAFGAFYILLTQIQEMAMYHLYEERLTDARRARAAREAAEAAREAETLAGAVASTKTTGTT